MTSHIVPTGAEKTPEPPTRAVFVGGDGESPGAVLVGGDGGWLGWRGGGGGGGAGMTPGCIAVCNWWHLLGRTFEEGGGGWLLVEQKCSTGSRICWGRKVSVNATKIHDGSNHIFNSGRLHHRFNREKAFHGASCNPNSLLVHTRNWKLPKWFFHLKKIINVQLPIGTGGQVGRRGGCTAILLLPWSPPPGHHPPLRASPMLDRPLSLNSKAPLW